MSRHLIDLAQAEGVTVTLTPAGGLRIIGDRKAVTRWIPTIRENKPDIMEAIRERSKCLMNDLSSTIPHEGLEVGARFQAWVSQHLPVGNRPLADAWAKIIAGELLCLTLPERRALRAWVPELVRLLYEYSMRDYPEARRFSRVLLTSEDGWGINFPDAVEG